MIWATLIAQYGLPFVIELTKLIESKTDPTSADFQALHEKHGKTTAADYLKQAQDVRPA